MKIYSRAVSTGQKMPGTTTMSLLDNELIIIMRSWGSSEHNQKFIDEIVHYLSSTQADLEVTTPFDYQENLSALANRTRVSLLLAHDYFYRNENKNEYLIGFEATVLFKSKNEVAWSSVGRFQIGKIVEQRICSFVDNGSDLDCEILLPVQLIGIEREIDISSGSMGLQSGEKVVISSVFRSEITVKDSSDSIESIIDVIGTGGASWYGIVTSE